MIRMRISYMMAAVLAVGMLAGCRKEDKTDYAAKIPGEWHCTPETFEADVYIAFDADGGFDLYQQVGEGRHRHYSGEWEVAGNVISGTYSNGAGWGSSYSVSFDTDDRMTFKAANGSDEVMTYLRENIPADVVEGSIDVKSAASGHGFTPAL